MLVVISDTHFAESRSNQLGNKSYNNNFPALVYKNYFQELAVIVRQHNLKSVDLVLAGDIFELTRTELWFKDELRPYVHNLDVQTGSEMEKRILNILDAIENDEHVGPTLELFRNIQQMIGINVKLHYLPGNHDRLVNSTPAIRFKIRTMLGLNIDPDPFSNNYIYAPENKNLVLVRHGHEYDRNNFGIDLQKINPIPILIDKNAYEYPVLGDFITLELGTRLPLEFKNHYQPQVILNDEKLTKIYSRLIEFDNVRPSSELFNFLLTTPGINNRETWNILEPIFLIIFGSWFEDDQFIKRTNFFIKSNSFTGWLLALLKKCHMKPKQIPYWLVKLISKWISRKMYLSYLTKKVAKEECILDEQFDIKCIIMGHSHVHEVELIGVSDGIEKYYINAGAWRNQIPASQDKLNFGHLRMLSKIIIFSPEEKNLEYSELSGWSFDINSELGYGYEGEH